MSSPTTSFSPSLLRSQRISHSTITSTQPASRQTGPNNTPPPLTPRRARRSVHLSSSLFDRPRSNMAMTLSSLSPDYPGEGCKAGEVFMHEWPIYDVKRFRDYIEDTETSMWTVEMELEEPDLLPEPLRRGIVIGGGWFKLDLTRTMAPLHDAVTAQDDASAVTEPKLMDTVSLFVAALSLDSSAIEITYPATIFVGIKPISTPIGSKFSETKYHWSTTADWEFDSLREFWEVKLPKLSDLLDIPEVAAQDAFTICVQISTPNAVKPTFGLPGQITVPRNIISGLNGLIDSTTGDVKFVCLEHTLRPIEGEDGDEKNLQSLSRKRVLYAHSEILKASCDYFHDLLTGEFEEAERARRGDSRYTTVLVDDAGFESVYWLLKFIYTNELSFADHDDVRSIMDQLRIDPKEINRILSPSHFYGPNEWEYRHLFREGTDLDELDNADIRTVKSVSSVSTRRSAMSPTPSRRTAAAPSSIATTTSTPQTAVPKTSSTSATPASKVPRPTHNSATPTPPRPRPKGPSTSIPKAEPAPAKPPSTVSPQGIGRSPYVNRVSDPHQHPCAPPAPASALSIFILSHRYGLDTLAGLAKDHILVHLTKDNCMPMLLATYQYDSLHSDVLDYIIDNWSSIQPTEEFLKCIQEVSAGVWGETGGMVLHGLFKRL